MRRLLGILAALAVILAPSLVEAVPKTPVLSGGPCLSVQASLNFVSGPNCLSGQKYASATAVPGWRFSRSGQGYAQTSAGTLTLFATGVPRITDQGLLIEQASTNLLLQSSNFTTTWTANGSPTVSSPTYSAPDGTSTATLWTRTSTGASYVTQSIIKAASSLAYTLSVYAKASVGNYVALRMQGSYPSRADVVFNLSNGTISAAATASSNFSAASASITPLAGGWYRLTLTATSDTITALQNLVSFNSNNIPVDGVDSVSNSAGYLFGAQLEQNSFATSYIPTTTTTATRGMDSASVGGLSIAPASITLSAVALVSNIPTDSGVVTFTDGTSNNGVGLVRTSGGAAKANSRTGGNWNTDTGLISGLGGQITLKHAVSLSGPSLNVSANGLLGTGSAIPPITNKITTVVLGLEVAGGYPLDGYIQSVKLWPVAKTPAQLQALTH